MTVERLVERGGRVYRVKTTITTYTLPSAPRTPERERDHKTAWQFMLEHGFWPGLNDGEAGEARRRLIEGNLRAQMEAPAQPWERDGGRWRRWSAIRQLARLDRRDHVDGRTRTRDREPRRPTRARRTGTRAGNSRDGPARPDDDELDARARAGGAS